MTPCLRNRKDIALMVIGALDSEKAATLRRHLAECQGCRGYSEEMLRLTSRLASAQPDSDLQASKTFHDRIARRLPTTQPSSALENAAGWVWLWIGGWRAALPVAAMLAIALFATWAARQNRDLPMRGPSMVQLVAPSLSQPDMAPSILNYQLIASQSLEKFEELLTRQGNESLPAAPVFTAFGAEGTAPF